MRRMTKQCGFTLIELIMVTIILGVIAVVLGRVLIQGYHSFTTENNISELNWKGFYILERMVNDIHNIRSYGDITAMAATQLTFTDKSGSSISYTYSGTNLLRNGQIIGNGVWFPSFSYYTSRAAITTTASTLSYVLISFYILQGYSFLPFSIVIGTRFPL
mgnify:CR=1 FL=1